MPSLSLLETTHLQETGTTVTKSSNTNRVNYTSVWGGCGLSVTGRAVVIFVSRVEPQPGVQQIPGPPPV